MGACKCQKDRGEPCAKGWGCSRELSSDAIDGVIFVNTFGRVRQKCLKLDQLFQSAGKPAVFEEQLRKSLCPLHQPRKNRARVEEIERVLVDPALSAAELLIIN